MTIEIYTDDLNQTIGIKYISGEMKTISYTKFLEAFEPQKVEIYK